MPLPTSLKRKLIQNLPETAYKETAILPASGIGTLFTIQGGPIMVTSLMGRVTTQISGTQTISININPTNSAARDMASVVTITNDLVHNIYKLNATFGSPLVVSTQLGGEEVGNPPFFISEGIITVTSTATDTTGLVEWYLTWYALHPAAGVRAGA